MPATAANICLVDGSPLLQSAFKRAGHRVLALTASPEPTIDLPGALRQHDFVPDLVLQVERLGPRSLLTGLDAVDCPLLFWAVDPHLNSHWHAAYGRLFDLVLSTQRAWVSPLKRYGAPDVRWLPWYGQDREQPGWDGRVHGLAFVGRLSPERSVRKWMVEFLEQRGAGFDPAIRQEVPYREMLELYGRSRIIPNESIFGEVNFRLFEGASCGCLVLGQDIEEQAELFEPGREMDTYGHVVEMGEKLDLYLNNDRLTRTMARAAHARVMAEHLPDHRAAKIVELTNGAARNRASGAESAKWMALTRCAMWESNLLDAEPGKLLDELTGAGQDADTMAAALRVQGAAGLDPLLDRTLTGVVGTQGQGETGDLDLAASMACLRRNDFKAARGYWLRQAGERGAKGAPPQDPKGLLTQWARDLHREGRVVRPGFGFDPGRHLSAVAVECLLLILRDEPDDLPTLRLMESMTRPVMGMEQARVGCLSVLTLHERKDWRLALEIGLANLRSYRLKSGLEELGLAHAMAVEQGQKSAFLRVLKGSDPSGLLATRLS